MTKQDALDFVTESELSADTKDIILKHINDTYSDELSESDVAAVETFFKKMAEVEIQEGMFYDKLANAVETAVDDATNAYTDYAIEITQEAKNQQTLAQLKQN